MHELVRAIFAQRSFCTFRLAQRLYGIDVAQVREVSIYLPMTGVPQAPPAVCGLFNLRSRIYLGLDLRPQLGLAATACTAESRLIILKPEIAKDVGLLVEQGGDIVHVPPDLIEPAGESVDEPAESQSSLIAGVCKLQAELLMVMDLTRISEIVSTLMRRAGSAT